MTSKWGKRLLSLGAVALGILADYLTKLLAVARLKGEDPVPFLRGVLRFSYVENPGAAWGMLANHRWVFMVFSAVAIAAMVCPLSVSMASLRQINSSPRCAPAAPGAGSPGRPGA